MDPLRYVASVDALIRRTIFSNAKSILPVSLRRLSRSIGHLREQIIFCVWLSCG
jgi:hypothetical protein